MITNCLCQTTGLKNIYFKKIIAANDFAFQEFLLQNVAIPGIILEGSKSFFIESLSL